MAGGGNLAAKPTPSAPIWGRRDGFRGGDNRGLGLGWAFGR
jgi:hypothetical protein